MSDIKTYLIDTNVIIQYLTKQIKEHSEAALALFEKAAKKELFLFIEPSVVAECFYVLEKQFNVPREDAVDNLSKYITSLKNVTTHNRSALTIALVIYRNDLELDFVDTYLGCLSKQINQAVITFNNKDFVKTFCRNYKPNDIPS